MIADKGGSPENAMLAEPESENTRAVEARRVIDVECTESQQYFFFEHFGEGTLLEEMRVRLVPSRQASCRPPRR